MITDIDLFDLDALDALDSAELREVFQQLEQHRRRVEGAIARVIDSAHQHGAFAEDGHRTVGGWCRALGRWSDSDVRQRLRVARLARADQRFCEAMTAGRIGVAQCQTLARAFANPRCGDQLLEVMEIMLVHAQHLTHHDFALVVQRWERLADADGTHRDDDAAHAHRRASLLPVGHQMHLDARLGSGQGSAMAEIFERFCQAEFLTDWEAARERFGEAATVSNLERTDAQRRADALYRIFLRAASAPADAREPEPLVNLVVDIHTYDLLINGRHTLGVPADPRLRRCETITGIPVPAADALSALWWGRIRRVVVDTASVPIDLGRSSRLFTGAARDAVMLQSTRCVVAGCAVSVARTQCDHLHEWQHHGVTASFNGAPACGGHNRLKSQRGFTVTRDQHGYWHTYRPDGTEITDLTRPVT
jgi:hypothetical protein